MSECFWTVSSVRAISRLTIRYKDFYANTVQKASMHGRFLAEPTRLIWNCNCVYLYSTLTRENSSEALLTVQTRPWSHRVVSNHLQNRGIDQAHVADSMEAYSWLRAWLTHGKASVLLIPASCYIITFTIIMSILLERILTKYHTG